MGKENSIFERKKSHIDVCLSQDVQSSRGNGFERYALIHEALPEQDFAQLNMQTEFLGKRIDAPLLISSMTGGTRLGETINRNLAEAAAALNLPFALGSQRIFLKNNRLGELAFIRQLAPRIPILSNVGAVQLNNGLTRDDLLRIVESVQADGLILHFNALQEVFQPGGNTNFAGLLRKIEPLAATFPVPLIAKEVGSGFSVQTARSLLDCGIAWIDVAGAGGTSWVKVESFAENQMYRADQIAPFVDWGIPTAEAIADIHAALPEAKLIASGGIRSGVEMRKALLLGARLCGIALPLLEPATISAAACIQTLETVLFQYKTACFVSSGIKKA